MVAGNVNLTITVEDSTKLEEALKVLDRMKEQKYICSANIHVVVKDKKKRRFFQNRTKN